MAANFFDKLHQINMKGLKYFSTQNKNNLKRCGKKKKGGGKLISHILMHGNSNTSSASWSWYSMQRFFSDVLNLPSLTVFSPWLFEWSGRSETSVWWECECLALRLSISVAVSELPRLVNFPRVKTRNGYLVYSLRGTWRQETVIEVRNWRTGISKSQGLPGPCETEPNVTVGYLVGVHWHKHQMCKFSARLSHSTCWFDLADTHTVTLQQLHKNKIGQHWKTPPFRASYSNLVSSPLVQRNRYIRMGSAKAKDLLSIGSEKNMISPRYQNERTVD